jgi:phospholipid transport system substrate-binding protein
MTMTRRAFALLLAAAPLAARAEGLTPEAARAFVERAIEDLEAIVKSAKPDDDRADAFLALFRRVAALPEIGRFTMGVTWRSMSEPQRAAFLEAFEGYAARAYSSRIGDYNGQTVVVTGTQSAGQRGVLVNSLLKQKGAADIRIDWLVSDRGGSIRLADIVAEGVSLSISQRETFAAMLERRGGDIDRFIADLARATPEA